MANVDSDAFKAALGSWAAGVTVATTELNGLSYAITASSFSSLSLDPPLILVCIASSNTFVDMVRESKHFSISILATGQDDVSNGFARSGREPEPQLPNVETLSMETGCPLITGAMAHLDCTLEELIPGGDHSIVVGRVQAAASDGEKEPLVYYRRDYRSVNLD
jgi:flavin reductase (DIM6/NTAB) family NADH-FMN oxidoreductase RutF